MDALRTLDIRPREDHECCQHLRTKSSYLNISDPYPRVPSDTAQYWCMHTQHVLGPDCGLVCFEDCAPGRSCFQAVGE